MGISERSASFAATRSNATSVPASLPTSVALNSRGR